MRHFLIGAAVIALAAGGANAQPRANDANDKPSTAKTNKDPAKTRGAADRATAPNVRGKARIEHSANGDRGKNANPNTRSGHDISQATRHPREQQDQQGRQDRTVDQRQPSTQAKKQQDQRRADRGAGRPSTKRESQESQAQGRQAQGRQERRLNQGRENPTVVRQDRRDRVRTRYVDQNRFAADRGFFARDRSREIIRGCPPGLHRKNNGCVPPGLANENYDQPPFQRRSLLGFSYRPGFFGLANYDPGSYFYNDGYLLRRNNGVFDGYIPLLGGALAVGNLWPQSYEYYPVSDYFVDYYNLGSQANYRYADNVIYRVDPSDAAIISVAALLTGDDIRIGQPMPRGYDVYNVPYAYRDQYRDTPDRWYRYSDGYVYEIDPETRLVSAAIDLLV